MESSRKTLVAGAVAVCASAVMWGFDGVVLTPNLYNLKVDYVVFILHLIPFVFMSVVLNKQFRHLATFSRSDFLFLFLVALFGGAIGTLAIVKALFLVEFKKLTIVVLLQKLQPIFAIALAALLLGEKPRRGFYAWAALAILSGYTLTFGFKLPDVDVGNNLTYASLLALLAAFSFGSSTVFSKKVLLRIPFHTATFYRYAFTTLIMGGVVLFTGSLAQWHMTTQMNWLIFLLIAVTTGSGAIFLYYYGLRRVKAIVATMCELCFPLSAILFDYIFNRHQLTLVQWVSAAVLLFSIVMLNLRYSIKSGD